MLEKTNSWDYCIQELVNGGFVSICFMLEDDLFEDYPQVTSIKKEYIVIDRNGEQVYEIRKGGGLWNF